MFKERSPKINDSGIEIIGRVGKMTTKVSSKLGFSWAMSIILLGGNILFNCITFNETYRFSTWWVMLMALFLGYVANNVGIKEKYMLLIVWIVVSIWSVLMPIYSPIDEGAWYAIIDYICKNGKMPLISQTANTADILHITRPLYSVSDAPMYEVVHPPLYFYSMFFLTGWISDSYIRFLGCRLMGGILLVLVVKCGLEIFRLLRKYRVIGDEEQIVLKKCIFIFALSPGVLTRFGTIANEGLAVLLVCLFMYSLIKYIFEDDSVKMLFILSGLVWAAIMTKTTTAFVFVILLIVLVYKKYYKQVLIPMVIVGGGSLPWLGYNYINYHSLTAMKQHIAFVHTIVNPGGRSIDIVEEMFNLFYSFFYPQEGYINNGVIQPIVYGLSMGCMIFCIYMIYKMIKVACLYMWRSKNLYVYSDAEKKSFLKIICALWILGNSLMLVIGSVAANLSLFVGRYLYLSIIPLIILIVMETKEAPNQIKRICIYIVIVMIVILDAFNIYGYGVTDGIDNIPGCIAKAKIVDGESVQMKDVINEDGYLSFGNDDPQIIINSNEKQVKGVEIQLGLLETEVNEFQFYYMTDEMDGFSEAASRKVGYNGITRSIRIANVDMQGIFRIDPPDNAKIKIDRIKVFY